MNITQRKPFSPGEILSKEFMEPLRLNQSQLAEILKVPRRRINEILNQRRAITSDTAIRLSKAFGTSADVWLNLQMKWELWHTLHDPQKIHEYEAIQRIVEPESH